MILSKEKQPIFRHNCLRRSIINAMVRQVSRDSNDNILTSFEYTIGANGERTSVYELKPYNPRQIHIGTRQLQRYLAEIEEEFGPGWSSVLDTY